MGSTYNQGVGSNPVRLQNQTLLFDADDTLWENNMYFDRAIAAFISFLDHRVHTAEEVKTHLMQCERATIAEHGYGLRSFKRSLVNCFEQLSQEALDDVKHERIASFVDAISTAEMELLPAVEETLAELQQRHRLLVVTKGNPDEQLDKLKRSGLEGYFSGVEVLAEKHEQAYRALSAHHSCETASTWMIGNSPKSDVNPALAAGLHAIFIPHDFTWVLEHEVINTAPAGQQLLELRSFAELTRYF